MGWLHLNSQQNCVREATYCVVWMGSPVEVPNLHGVSWGMHTRVVHRRDNYKRYISCYIVPLNDHHEIWSPECYASMYSYIHSAAYFLMYWFGPSVEAAPDNPTSVSNDRFCTNCKFHKTRSSQGNLWLSSIKHCSRQFIHTSVEMPLLKMR